MQNISSIRDQIVDESQVGLINFFACYTPAICTFQSLLHENVNQQNRQMACVSILDFIQSANDSKIASESLVLVFRFSDSTVSTQVLLWQSTNVKNVSMNL